MNSKLDDSSFVAMHAFFVSDTLASAHVQDATSAGDEAAAGSNGAFSPEVAVSVQRSLLETAGHLTSLASFSQIALESLNPGEINSLAFFSSVASIFFVSIKMFLSSFVLLTRQGLRLRRWSHS